MKNRFILPFAFALAAAAPARSAETAPLPRLAAPAAGSAPIAPEPRLEMDPAEDGAALWEKGYRAVYDQLRKNLRERANRPRYAYPAPKYQGVYLWDSAFIAEVWRDWDPAVGEEIIESVLRNQKRDGRVPQVKSFFGSSRLSNPPLLSWSALRLYRATGDLEFLRRVYGPLEEFHAWYDAARRRPDGLYFWKHPYESGLDNSPRFSDRQEAHFDDTTRIAAVDLSSYMTLDAESLAAMADELELGPEAAAFRAEAAAIRAAINERLWDEDKKMYLDRRDDGRFVEVESIASLTPLVAGVPSAGRAALVVAAISDPARFNTAIPFPSVSRSDPSFQKDCWRGPVWVNMAYLALLGMKRYGYDDQAREMGRRLVGGVYETWEKTGKLVEFYDPDRTDFSQLTRKKGNLYKRLTLGAKPVAHFVGWTGLVNNVAVDIVGEKETAGK
jgi:hypothetical protein